MTVVSSDRFPLSSYSPVARRRLAAGLVTIGALALTACGGGGSSGTGSSAVSANDASQIQDAQGAARYAGTWKGCLAAEAGVSHRVTYTFAANGNGGLDYESSRQRYESADCSGAEAGQLSESGRIELNGMTKEIDGKRADLATYAPVKSNAGGGFVMTNLPLPGINGGKAPWALYVQGGDLWVATFRPLGSDGYPEHLNTGTLKRQ